jgi:hypothetical protein
LRTRPETLPPMELSDVSYMLAPRPIQNPTISDAPG